MALRFGLSLQGLYIPNIPGIIATVVVSGIVGAYRDLHLQIRALNNELRSLNRTDSLTGLLNRRGVFETAERIFDVHLRRRRSGLATQAFACAILDLDHFKEINDRHGHLTGDMVLRKIGGLLSEHFRGTDIVGRCGGEEFLIILPDTDAKAAGEAGGEGPRHRLQDRKRRKPGGQIQRRGYRSFCEGRLLRRTLRPCRQCPLRGQRSGSGPYRAPLIIDIYRRKGVVETVHGR